MIKSGRKTGNRRPRPFFFPSPFASQSRTSFLFSFKKKKKKKNKETNEKRTEIDPSFPFSSKFSANSSIFSFWFESKNQTDRSFHGNGRGFSELTRDCKHLPFGEKKKKKTELGTRPVARPPVDFSPLRERERGRERDVATVTGVYRFVTGPPSFPRNTRTGREKKSTRFFQEEKNEKVETIPPSPILLHVSLFLLNAAGNRKKERKRLVLENLGGGAVSSRQGIIAAERDPRSRGTTTVARQQRTGQVAVGLRVLGMRVSHRPRGEHPFAAGDRAPCLLFPILVTDRSPSSFIPSNRGGEVWIEASTGEAVEARQVDSGEGGQAWEGCGSPQVRRQ